jgi:hypothetical protein
MKPKAIVAILLVLTTSLACTFVTGTTTPETSTSPSSESAPTIVDPTPDQAVSSNVQDISNNDPRGYILFAPLRSTTTYLLDYDGDVVHTWPSQYNPGNAVYLLGNGNLLRTGSLRNSTFDAGGAGGIVQGIDWDGNVVWQFEYASDQHLLHHDVSIMPNGHILMIAWEYKTADEAIAAGRDPSQLSDKALWPDSLIEVDPATNQIVWEWHVWDHLIQDYDPSKANYGDPAEHPEKINLNYADMPGADWTHINSVDYNPELDQILVSVHNFSEIWIIDHNTTTAEAAGPAGDLLYRWGNPQAYGAGTQADQQLFAQHDAYWIESGLPGAGNILVFNNGNQHIRPYSTVDEITPPLNPDGSYSSTPVTPQWTYTAETPTDFFAHNISGAQRLPNGDTLICNGPAGIFFEVDPSGKTVWTYTNPFGQNDGQSPVFRASYYTVDYPGLADKTLTATSNPPTENQTTQKQPTGSGRTPGPRAIQACEGLSQGDACSFTSPKGTLSGTCTASQSQLACAPAGGMPGNQ